MKSDGQDFGARYQGRADKFCERSEYIQIEDASGRVIRPSKSKHPAMTIIVMKKEEPNTE